MPDDLLDVSGEIGVKDRRVTGLSFVLFRQRNTLRDRTTRWIGGANHGQRLCVPFDNHFFARLDSFQNRSQVSYGVGFAYA